MSAQTKHTPGLRASASKSYGAFKPMIVYPTGRTEIVGTNQRNAIAYRRGATFERRDDAVAYAERVISGRIARLIQFNALLASYGAQRAARAALAKAEGQS